MKDTVKALLYITDDSEDAVIEALIAEVTAAVLAYTRREEIDEALSCIIAHIAADVYASLPTSSGVVTSLSEGERRVEFAAGIAAGGYIGAYADVLDAFRDKRGYVPSDVENIY